MDDCFKSTGKIVEEVRIMPEFESLEVEDRINVYIRQDKQNSVMVKAGKNLQEHIDLKVEGRRLYLRNNNKCNWVRSYKKDIDVFISLKKLSYIAFRGGGNIEFTTAFVQDSLVVDMWNASGDLKVNLYGKHLSLKSHAGSADLQAYGICEDLVLYSNGNGYIDAKAVQTKRALVVNKNSGLLSVKASELLNAEILGRGNIESFGTAPVSLKQLGLGKLIIR